MKHRFRNILIVSSLLALTSLAVGCGHATLNPGGAYAPLAITNADNTVTAPQADFEFYVADSAFEIAHNAIQTVTDYERDNRLTLWRISPEIKHSLDQVRPQIVKVELKYALARKAYMANPVTERLTTLQGILQEAQRLQATVSAVLPANAPNAPPK